MKGFTIEQYSQLLNDYLLFSLGRLKRVRKPLSHSAGIEFTSIMNSFMMFNISACQSLLKLASCFGKKWYPVSVGYIIDRTIFEVLITARYISLNPKIRSKQYIDYGKIISKKKIDAILKHRDTKKQSWKEIINHILSNELNSDKISNVDDEYKKIQYIYKRSRGKREIHFNNWSGKNIREMACEVDHELEYDLFYNDLSSYSHANVKLADQYIRKKSVGLYWTQAPMEFEIFSVFRYAATFYECFLELFGEEFGMWSTQELRHIYDNAGTDVN